MSNWASKPPPLVHPPRELDLDEFAFTALPKPNGGVELPIDDLEIDHYLRSVRSYSGTQRMGINGPSMRLPLMKNICAPSYRHRPRYKNTRCNLLGYWPLYTLAATIPSG